MGIYVKTPTGKEPLQKKVTASEIKEALGYTPANPDDINIPDVDIDLSDIESNDDTFYIVDKNDNIVAKIDRDGIHTTTVNANEVSLGSSLSLKEHLEDAQKAENSKYHVTEADRKKWNDNTAGNAQDILQTQERLNEHINSGTRHWSDADRKALDTSDDEVFYIVDNNDNIIAQVDSDGLHVLNVKIGKEGKTIAEMLEGYAKTSDLEDLATTADVNTKVDGLNDRIDTVEDIAKGANRAKSFNTYDDLIAHLNSVDASVYGIGQNFYISVLNVPDLWVASVTDGSLGTYPGNADDLLNDLKSGIVTVNCYGLSVLETQRVVLTDYVKKTEQDTALANLKEEIGEEVVSDKEEFHIVDKDDNIVATIDENGVQSVAFLDKNGEPLTNLTPLFTRTKKVAGFSSEVLTDLGYSAVITLDTKCRSVENVKLLTTNGFNSQEVTISHYEGRITVAGWVDSPIKAVYANISYTASHADHASSAETCATTPTIDTHIANKKYVDDEIYKFSSGDNTVKTAQTANALKSGYSVNNAYGSTISVYFNTGKVYVVCVAYEMYNYNGVFINMGGSQAFMLYSTLNDEGIKCSYSSTASTISFTKGGESISVGSCYVREL